MLCGGGHNVSAHCSVLYNKQKQERKVCVALCFKGRRPELEARAHTIGHTGRNSPSTSAQPLRRTSETLPLPQVSPATL